MTTYLSLTSALEDCFSSSELTKNEIFLNIKQSQVKVNDQLTGEILLDLKKLIGNSSIILTIQCKESIFKKNDCIFEEIVMSVKSEVFQIGSDIQMVVPHIYKIPLNIVIPDVFNSSENIKLDNDLSVKTEYEIFCQVVQSIDLPQESQVKITSKNSFMRRSNENIVNQINPNLEGRVILQSSAIPLQIINNSNTKKSEPVAITQLIKRRQLSFIRSLGILLCCRGSNDQAHKLKNQQKSYIKQNEVTHFEIDINTINLYPGETFSFLVKDDGIRPDLNKEIRYSARLVAKQSLKIKGEVQEETKILYEKQVSKNTSEKVTIPYSSQLSYNSNNCKISYELQVAPLGYSYDDANCLHAPIHINPKKLKLIRLMMSDDSSEDSEIESLRLSVKRLLSNPHKTIAKISLKFDDQIEEQREISLSQKSTNFNTPDITPLRRSFE